MLGMAFGLCLRCIARDTRDIAIRGVDCIRRFCLTID